MTSLEILICDFREGNIVSTEEKRLTLAYEGLTEVPQTLLLDYAPILEILDLSHNKLLYIDFLSQCKNLTTLILDHNNISSETAFPPMPSVTTLWLNHNLINKLHPFIQQLGESCPNLTCLSLMGNEGAPSYLTGGTYYEYLQYRLFVISWLPKLEYLDDRNVRKDQREEAQRLYGRPFYHSLHSPQQYFQQFQKKFKEIFDSFQRRNFASPNPLDDRIETVGAAEAIHVQDMGNITNSDSSSSTDSSSNYSFPLSRRRSKNFVI